MKYTYSGFYMEIVLPPVNNTLTSYWLSSARVTGKARALE